MMCLVFVVGFALFGIDPVKVVAATVECSDDHDQRVEKTMTLQMIRYI